MRHIWFRSTVFSALLGFWALAGSPAARAEVSPAPTIRFLIPNTAFSEDSHPVLADLIERYSRTHPGQSVSLIRRGEEYSSIRELLAMRIAGNTPELATVEYTEARAISGLNLVRQELPFTRVVPVLLVNEELLFKNGLRALLKNWPKNWPKSWDKLVQTAKKLTSHSSKPSSPGQEAPYALALPLQGARGLWLFEAIAGKPLWHREAGGLRANRELAETVTRLQNLIDTPNLIRPGLNLSRSVQDFIDGRVPLLVTSLDLLPELTSKAKFPWQNVPLPCPAQTRCVLQGGSNLLVTSDSPEVREFISYWYSPEIAARWSRALSSLPPTVPAIDLNTRISQYDTILKSLANSATPRSRSSDPDVVRARSAWIQILPLLFGEASRRLPSESVFLQLDRALNQAH